VINSLLVDCLAARCVSTERHLFALQENAVQQNAVMSSRRRAIAEPPASGNLRRVSEPLSAYMTTSDIAAYLGVKLSTVTAYVARGQFPPADAVVGSTKLWRRATVQSWAAQRPRKGSPPTPP
jgi:excisionase family DNA binding protein